MRSSTLSNNFKFSELQKRITFQKPLKTDDGNFGSIITWQDVATVWAKIEPLSGREFFESQQIQKEITHKITIRSRKDINETMRIKYEERYFNIEAILDLEEKGKIMEIMATE